MTLQRFKQLACAIAIALPLGAGGASADQVLRVATHADLSILDPIFTTANISQSHGMMVYDTLLSMDSKGRVKPQMLEGYTVSPDGLSYTFTLRPGQKWHDGASVTAADCVASLKRWGARDSAGQRIMSLATELAAVDDRTFKLTLKEPFGLLLESLAKTSSNIPFMMPARIAATDPTKQITDATGSGPFKFSAKEWVPGSIAVYTKNPNYVPRNEPPDGAAGGRVAKVDRVEFVWIPDAQTAVNALIAGEIDYLENPRVDALADLRKNKDIAVDVVEPLGRQALIRMNHVQPPFNHPAARQALAWLVKQDDFMRAIAGDPSIYKTCPAFFACGSAYETAVGSEAVMGYDVEKAKQLFKEAGYDGRPVAILNPTDNAEIGAIALVTAQALRSAGVKVDLISGDLASVYQRRANKGTPQEGGWNIFGSWHTGLLASNPAFQPAIGAGCDKAWFGWPCDEKLEALRTAWVKAGTLEERRKITDDLQKRAYEVLPYIPLGQWFSPVAYRKDLKGVLKVPGVLALWNIEDTSK